MSAEEQQRSAYVILSNYHPAAVEELRKVIDTAKDLSEHKIVSDLLRKGLEHMLTGNERQTTDTTVNAPT